MKTAAELRVLYNKGKEKRNEAQIGKIVSDLSDRVERGIDFVIVREVSSIQKTLLEDLGYRVNPEEVAEWDRGESYTAMHWKISIH